MGAAAERLKRLIAPWWKRESRTSASAVYNPATDEPSLDRCVQRLQEILAELGPIGAFLDEMGDLTSGPELAALAVEEGVR
jgi:hypothetical protein